MAVTAGAGRAEENFGERRRMGRQMAESLEWVIFAYQSATLIQTAWINPFQPFYRAIILGLAGVHAILALRVRTRRRLIIGDRRWTTAWMAAAVTVPLAIALMAPHDLYAANPSCVAACTYPAPVLLIVSLYPWVFSTWLLQTLAGPMMIVSLLAAWLVLLYALGNQLTLTAAQSILVSVLWISVGYGIGLALRRLVNIWLRNRREVEQRAFEAFVDFLHSHIKAGLAAVDLASSDPEGVRARIRDLQEVLGEKRLSLLLAKDHIPLAMLFSERIRVFNGLVSISAPRIGARTVSPTIGRLLDRALGDLLKNTAVHGATNVRVEFEAGNGWLVLAVIDDGPGFDNGALDDPGKALYSLRTAARGLGGDLIRNSCHPRGSQLTLVVRDDVRSA